MSLRIEGVSKRFGGFQALDEVTLSVPAGALFGLIGPNGAGKSTLFAVVSGFSSADAGSVSLDGRDLGGMQAAQRARAGLVRTFQVPREFSHLSVRDNLMAAAPDQAGESLANVFFRPRRVRRDEAAIASRAEDTIRLLRLGAVADEAAGRLSGGQKKLLELGRALMLEPRLILLDEPFAGVNRVLIGEIGEKILELNARGIGFLVIEHDLEALVRLVSTLAVMDRGRLIADGPPNAVLEDARVRDAYLGGTP